MANEVTAAEETAGKQNTKRRGGRSKQKSPMHRVIDVLASLKLTVILFALSIFLIFAGTLAQVDLGIWAVMEQYFRTTVAWVELEIFFPEALQVPGGFPFPGGWLLGALILVNLVAAHAVRFKVSWRRSGIILVHAGLIVMVVSEFVTGLFATEGRMTINEGETSNYTEDIRTVELAVIDRSPEEHNEVTVVPEKVLRAGGMIQDPALPVDIEVHRYMKNSSIQPTADMQASVTNQATAGYGQKYVAFAQPVVSGTSADQQIDAASAYVTFHDKESGESLGTYLVSLWFAFNDLEQEVQVGDKTYTIGLRFKRTYKDYQLHLFDFHHDQYIGTDKPKNFQSDIRLIDRSENVDREVKIFMNHPLRYNGETFYQASFKPDNSATILQVVRNPGWMMPYISCAMVSGGLLIQFGLSLTQFLRKRLSQ